LIQKGNRNAVIGYKPQVIRSEAGFISAIIVKEGNVSDSKESILVMFVLTQVSRFFSKKTKRHFFPIADVPSI
jgi:hypothetical protein